MRRNGLIVSSMVAMLGAAAFAGEATVERGDLVIRFERKARVEPISKRPVRFEPEVYGGRLELGQRARDPGPVKAGDELMVLTSREFAEQLEDAKTLAVESERRLEVTRQERRIGLEQAKVGSERAEFAAEVALRNWNLFREFDSKKTLEQRELGLQWQRDSFKDENEELRQLEKMYSGTSLADETKDIVLDRARRSIKRGERFLAHSEQDYKNFVQFLHPQNTKQIEDNSRFAAFDLEVAKNNLRLAGVRTELDLAAAERGVRDAKRRAERLDRDRERLTLRAPIDGYWLPQVREQGDQANAWQPVGEVADVSTLRLRGSLDPMALRILAGDAGPGAIVGTSASMRWTSRPDLVSTATFTEFVTVGTPEGDSTAFPFFASIPADSGAMVGLEAILFGSKKLTGVLLVPDKAVKGAPSRPTVKKKGPDGEKEVEVRLGPSADGKVVVVEGLAEGDVVVVPDA